MATKQLTITINDLVEAIRQRYDYKWVHIDAIEAGARLSDLQNIKLGPGSILDMAISVEEKSNG